MPIKRFFMRQLLPCYTHSHFPVHIFLHVKLHEALTWKWLTVLFANDDRIGSFLQMTFCGFLISKCTLIQDFYVVDYISYKTLVVMNDGFYETMFTKPC